MRIAVLGLSHESNTYSPVPASLDRWLAAGPVEGADLFDRYASSEASLAGYLELASEPGIDLVPLVFYDLTPMGAITADAFETMAGRLVAGLERHGPWDAILLALHGAAVSEGYRDADGEILRRVRSMAGPDVPIGLVLDMHANISPAIVEHATLVTTYMTNPHLDARRRARLAADLTLSTVREEIRPVMALEMPPLAVNILRQGTDDSPMRELVALAHVQARRPGVLAMSVAEGFPYADVEEMGMAFLCVTDGDPDLASEAARIVAGEAWRMRSQLDGKAVAIEDALLRAANDARRPIVLLDVGDNVGGGSPGDSTHVLAAARRLGIGGLFQSLCDPEAVRACQEAGVGGTVSISVGGKTDGLHGEPVPITGTVRLLDGGKFEDPGATHGGFRFYDAGDRAVVHTAEDHLLMLISLPMGNTSLQQLISAGIDPLERQVIVAKGVHSPRAAFEPIAADMIWMATPGCTTADLGRLDYRHRRRPMFPYEPEASYPER